jgi:hypothetical protein
VELQETTQEEKQQSGDDLKIKTATFSAMLEGSGLRLEVTNLQASDFVFVEGVWNPRRVSGQVRYTSPTLQFSGSVNAQWENLNPSGFGKEDAPVPLAQIQKGSSSLQGNWTPKIGRPAGIQVNFISNPTGTPQVQMNLTINYGDQKLSGTITGTLDIATVNGQQVSKGFKSGNLDMTHTPSNFKVQVSGQKGQAGAGAIKTADGTKVADIGEVKNLGLSDLGRAWIVKYTDGSFETLDPLSSLFSAPNIPKSPRSPRLKNPKMRQKFSFQAKCLPAKIFPWAPPPPLADKAVAIKGLRAMEG